MRRSLLLMVGGLSDHGGAERSNRLAVQAWTEFASEHNFELAVVSRNDRSRPALDEDVAFYPCRGSKSVFLRACLSVAVRSRPSAAYCGLVSFGPVARTLTRGHILGRYVVQLHGSEVWSPIPRSWRVALERADRVVAVSDYTARHAERHAELGPGSVEVIPLALPIPIPPVSASRTVGDGITFLSVARLDHRERKGIDEVIHALVQMRAAGQDVRYVVIGEGQDRPRLEDLARSVGIFDVVRFRGAVSEAELHAAFTEADAFILPSTQEGFGVVFLEAMAHGLPIVAAAAGGVPEVVTQGEGILVPPRDEVALADAMRRVAGDRALRLRLGKGGIERVGRRYIYERYRADTFRLLDQLMEI